MDSCGVAGFKMATSFPPISGGKPQMLTSAMKESFAVSLRVGDGLRPKLSNHINPETFSPLSVLPGPNRPKERNIRGAAK
jgi:hypothetical protein